ncbi:MAG: hypothetical protein BAJALOKI2v1_770012 [Promethearchaeota archaeon]|nr:MAG: hypothetical protein BAJALOKI2v1_770012 [Candidatus Lokiarchaeota archaeon]
MNFKDNGNNEKEEENYDASSASEEDAEDWDKMTQDLTNSVSELVGTITKSIRPSLKGLKSLFKLGSMGKKFEKFGEEIEKAVKNSGLEDLDKNIEVILKAQGDKKATQDEQQPAHFRREDLTDIPVKGKESEPNTKISKEKMKKRVKGLIKLKHSVDSKKLTQILDIEEKEAQKIVEEIASQGIEGNLEGNIFKIEQDPEDVIRFLNRKIEELT